MGPSNDMPPPQAHSAYEGAGVTPLLGDEAKPHSPIFRYPLADVKDAMAAMPETADGARRIRYTNPLTGGPAMPGIDCYMLQPGRGRDTRAYRTNANMVCLAVEGEGVSKVGDHTMRWGKNDIFSLPRGYWISHRAESEEALLFQLTDREVLASLHYLREEFRD